MLDTFYELIATFLNLNYPQFVLREGSLTSKDKNAVLVNVVDGTTSLLYFGTTNPALDSPYFQVTIRSETGNSSINAAKDLRDYFATHAQEIANTHGISLYRIGDLTTLGRNPLGQMEYLLTYRCVGQGSL